MNTNETANQILEESASTNPQLTENPEKVQEAGLWAQIKAKKKYIFTGIGIVALAGVAYGIGSKKLVVGMPGLREETVKQLPKRIIEVAPEVKTIESVVEEMTESKRAYTRPTEPFIRNMAEWKHHSAAKAAQAAALDIPLESNQTLVVFSKDAA